MSNKIPVIIMPPLCGMAFRFSPYTIELKHTFTLATGSRTTTPGMMVEVELDGVIGYGEASMPPYLGETQATAADFFPRVDFTPYRASLPMETILRDIDGLAQGHSAAKAAVDIALHDWLGKKMGRAWHEIWGLDPKAAPLTSFTIGIDKPEIVWQRVKEADEYQVLKVKLGRDNNREIVETVRKVTSKPIRVDVNQGWNDREEALRLIDWLASKNVELVEQPLARERVDDHAWLKERSPLPIIADESVARFGDIAALEGVFDGINVKLMKCTGMHEAHRMIHHAHATGMKVMLGCMTETSCAISAAAQLSPLADWADLDGALLIKNDPFGGARVVEGRIVMPEGPGIGVTKLAAYPTIS